MNIIQIIIFSVISMIIKINCLDKELQCGYEICDKEGGNCVNNFCKCYPGYLTKKSSSDHTETLHCNYKQISSIKAGMIEMIIGCGIGHFYAGRQTNGTIKLFLVSIFCTCCFASIFMIKKIREETNVDDHPYVSLLFMLSVAFKIFLILWQLVDSILFFMGFYDDGLYMPLY